MIRVQATRRTGIGRVLSRRKQEKSRERIHFLIFFRKLGFLSVGGDFSCDATAGEFLDRIDVGVSRKRSQVSIDYFYGFIESFWGRKRYRLIENRFGGFDVGFKIDMGVSI